MLTAPVLLHCDVSDNPINSAVVFEHATVTAVWREVDAVMSRLWRGETNELAFQRQHRAAQPLPVAMEEHLPIRRTNACVEDLLRVFEKAVKDGLSTKILLEIQLSLLCCKLQKLRFLKAWVDSAQAHLRTHQWTSTDASSDNVGPIHKQMFDQNLAINVLRCCSYLQQGCPCDVSESMVDDAHRTRTTVLEDTCRLCVELAQRAESSPLSDSQFLFFHLGFACCLQALSKHEQAILVRFHSILYLLLESLMQTNMQHRWPPQHLEYALARYHDLPSAHVNLLRSQVACGQYVQAAARSSHILSALSHLLSDERREEVHRLSALAAEGSRHLDAMGFSSAGLRRAFDRRSDDIWTKRLSQSSHSAQDSRPATGNTATGRRQHQLEHIRRQCAQAKQHIAQCRAALEAFPSTARSLSTARAQTPTK